MAFCWPRFTPSSLSGSSIIPIPLLCTPCQPHIQSSPWSTADSNCLWRSDCLLHLSKKLQPVSGPSPAELSPENVIMNYVQCTAHQDMDWNGLCNTLQWIAYGSVNQLINIWVSALPYLVNHHRGSRRVWRWEQVWFDWISNGSVSKGWVKESGWAHF